MIFLFKQPILKINKTFILLRCVSMFEILGFSRGVVGVHSTQEKLILDSNFKSHEAVYNPVLNEITRQDVHVHAHIASIVDNIGNPGVNSEADLCSTGVIDNSEEFSAEKNEDCF